MAVDVVVLLVPLPVLCSTRGTMYNHAYTGGRSVAHEVGQPEYRRVMNALRRGIADEKLKVGMPIPSTDKLIEEHGVSKTVIRRAVDELKAEGLLEGRPGKGVYVRARPTDLQVEHQSVLELAQGLEAVQAQIRVLQSVDVEILNKVNEELRKLRGIVAMLQAQLMNLYARVGQPYPRDAAPLEIDGDQDTPGANHAFGA
ncbi:winged helix-turn-helix domain-containing protein [Streptomyces sp. NPDC087532]|uniref:winged helix-turn-helix domain-containing protein n=1 Tax=Streptomyces sp. NPDC087532 TaxID=3365795 RepID=UPI00381EC302